MEPVSSSKSRLGDACVAHTDEEPAGSTTTADRSAEAAIAAVVAKNGGAADAFPRVASEPGCGLLPTAESKTNKLSTPEAKPPAKTVLMQADERPRGGEQRAAPRSRNCA